MAPDLYISADIEADGPIPGKYSMLAFGLAVAGRFDGRYFEGREPREARRSEIGQQLGQLFDEQKALPAPDESETRLALPPARAAHDQ